MVSTSERCARLTAVGGAVSSRLFWAPVAWSVAWHRYMATAAYRPGVVSLCRPRQVRPNPPAWRRRAPPLSATTKFPARWKGALVDARSWLGPLVVSKTAGLLPYPHLRNWQLPGVGARPAPGQTERQEGAIAFYRECESRVSGFGWVLKTTPIHQFPISDLNKQPDNTNTRQ